jgi:toxin ParE1/3/4
VTEVVWSPEALRDLEAIRDYIARDSSAYADLVVRRILAAVERLRIFPESGRVVPERNDPAIREIIVRPYRVVYRRRDDTVQIVTAFRASRLLTFPTED